MKSCEFVIKNEVKKYKKEFQNNLPYIMEKFKDKYGKSFIFSLVGSAQRNLVVRRGESLYDIDYQFIFPSLKLSENDNLDLKEYIKKLLEQKLGKNFNVNLSHSVITIVKKIKEDDYPINNIDIALIRINEKSKNKQILIGKSWDQNSKERYRWEDMKDYDLIISKKREIKGSEWANFRNLFLDKKCTNFISKNKKDTISIYLETLNEFKK